MSGVKPAVWFPAVRAGTGSDKFTLQLCEALNARGIRAGITWLPHRAEYLPWTVRVPPVPGWANIVHVNTWLHPRFLPRGIPVVATLHHSVHDPALRPYKGALRAAYHRFWIAPIERRVMARAAKVVAVSRFAAEIGRATLCETPIKVIHNGIDVDRFRPIGERESPHRPFRLLYVGSWIARKGVDLLAPIMRELGPEYVLHYTGSRSASGATTTLTTNMVDLGRLEAGQVIRAMQESDVLIFPSRSEGFGLVVAEAMASGLPVIATRASSLPEIVEDGVTGILCERDDVAGFAEAARVLQGSPTVWRRMSVAAAMRAQALFGLDAMTASYEAVYRSLLDGSLP